MQLGVERQNSRWSGGRGLQGITKSRKKGSRRRKKGSRGKENKLCSNWACTTTNMEGGVKCTAKLLCYSQCCAFFLKQPPRRRPFTFTILICFEKCALWRKPCKIAAPCPSCFSLQSHVHTYCNYQHEMICLCVRCPRQTSYLASVKEKYFNGKHRTCESNNWKILEGQNWKYKHSSLSKIWVKPAKSWNRHRNFF